MSNAKWNADAEMSMMGFSIRVESEEHLKHMVGYVLWTLQKVMYENRHQSLETRTAQIVENAMHKYNSSKDKSIKWFTVNDTDYGVMMTFVRDKGELTLKSGKMKSSGILAWVENVEYPDCSELGYVFFENHNGKIVRIG